jgi:ParB-like chromosome segregation protein Spo0J
MSTKFEPKIEIWSIDQVVPYTKNAKKHDDEQVATLAKLIETNGWTQPIVVDRDGVIIAGHGRRLAAIKLGRLKVPVIQRSDLTPAQANALRLSDNRVTSTAYHMDLLQDELIELSASGEIDMEHLGFSGKELSFLSVDDLAAVNLDSFIDDVGAAVENQKAENAKKAAETDGDKSAIGDAFGFKKVTVAQSRRIKSFMSQIEAETGEQGAEALMVFFDSIEA